MKIVAFCLLVLFLSTANSEPSIKTGFIHYKIYPHSRSSIDREMQINSPITTNGKKHNGHTDWYVKWSFNWRIINSICVITKVSTDLNIKYTMPMIPESHKVKINIRHAFNQYYNALFNHEKNHMTSGLYAAREIENSILKLNGFKNCKDLETIANTIGNKIIKKYNKRDKAYDKRTKHGQKVGINIYNFI